MMKFWTCWALDLCSVVLFNHPSTIPIIMDVLVLDPDSNSNPDSCSTAGSNTAVAAQDGSFWESPPAAQISIVISFSSDYQQ